MVNFVRRCSVKNLPKKLEMTNKAETNNPMYTNSDKENIVLLMIKGKKVNSKCLRILVEIEWIGLTGLD